jgi:hypothetical protein
MTLEAATPAVPAEGAQTPGAGCLVFHVIVHGCISREDECLSQDMAMRMNHHCPRKRPSCPLALPCSPLPSLGMQAPQVLTSRSRSKVQQWVANTTTSTALNRPTAFDAYIADDVVASAGWCCGPSPGGVGEHLFPQIREVPQTNSTRRHGTYLSNAPSSLLKTGPRRAMRRVMRWQRT